MKKIGLAIGAIILTVVFIGSYGITANKHVVNNLVIIPPEISAKDAILMDCKNGDILFERNAHEKAYPASTTKIMTCLLAIEICEKYDISLDSKVKIPKQAVGVEGSSIYLKHNEERPIEELLYGSMLRSGNDSATALAIATGGNMRNFVEEMNARAEKLGCEGTHFTNPTGLHDEKHYTTAYDLALMAREGLKNERFRLIAGSKSWNNFRNKNKAIYEYKGATGVKIGFTKIAGRTLVTSAKRKGKELIAVVLGDGNWFQDAYRLLDYGFRLESGNE